jgi:phosphoserine phosphatase RsbU/P
MSKSKVLVAEDHPMSRRMLEAFLSARYSVVTAASGREAVDAARRERPDIVLLDVEMPDMDGFQAIDILKQGVIDQAVPVIFLTARNDSESREKGLEAGAVDYITKPYDKQELSIKVKNHLALYEARKQIEERNMVMAREMETASQLQGLLLPQEHPRTDKLHFSFLYRPFSATGGDFYDFVELSDSRIGFVQVDVSGHGVASAMIGAMFKMAFQSFAPAKPSPAELLTMINDEMFRVLPDSDFLTVFYGVVDTESLELTFTNAGHPRPLLLRSASRAIEELSIGGMLVGVLPGAEYEEGIVQLMDRDRLLMFTDGVTETFVDNRLDEAYGEERLKQIFRKNQHMEPDDVLTSIVDDLERFSGASSFEDDITLLMLSVKSDSPEGA